MSNEWKQSDPETAKCMVNFLLDELQPQLWTKKKDAIATFTSYYFRSFPIYDDMQIRTIFLGDSSRRGLLQACGQISWKSFKIKTSSVRSLDLLVDLLDDAKNKEAASFLRIFLSLDDASFKQMRLDKLLNLRETKAKATTVMNILQSNGRQVPVSDADDIADGVSPNSTLQVGERDRQISSRHRDSVMVPTPQAAAFIPAPTGSRSQFTSLMAKLSSLLSRRPNFSALVEKGIVQAPKAFGRPLAEVVARSNLGGVPTFLTLCCDYLRENAFDKVGLFRVSGEQAEVFRLKRMIDYESGFSLDNVSPHSVAGLIKLWVRELPEPLLTFGLYDAMVKCTRDENWAELDRLEASLPATNLRIFQYLCSFLAEVSQKSELNKMTPSNLAIVFAPNLIRPIIETFEAIARDTPVTIATIRYFIEKVPKVKSQSSGELTSTTINEPTSTTDTPLPENWTVYLDETTGAPFFYNCVTNESRWDRPTANGGSAESNTEQQAPKHPSPPSPTRSANVLPPGWVEFCDEKTGVPYYYNEATDECSWVRPAGNLVPDPPKDPFEDVKFSDHSFSFVINGKWDKDSAGGAFPEISWFQNPQWLVHVPDSGPAKFRVNLATTAKTPMGVHIITVPVNRTAEHGRLLTVQSEEQIVLIGPFQESNDQIQQSTIEANLSGPSSLMIIPATNVPGVFADFKMSVSCDHSISMTEILDAGVWHKIVAHSDWSENTSGGCYPNFSSWRSNNQFKLTATDVTHPIRVLIQLQRQQSDPDYGAIGIYVLANNGPAEEKLGVCDGDVLARSEFVTANETLVELVVPTNVWPSSSDSGVKHVVVVPCTYEPGIVDTFTLTVYADHNISLVPISNRWSVTRALSSCWSVQNSGGCRNYETWQKNPSFTLSCPPSRSNDQPSSWSAMCIVSQPDPEHILPIGFYVIDTTGRTRCKGTFSLAPEVFGQMTFRRDEAPYTFYACTFNPGLAGDFNVQVFSEYPCTLEPCHSPRR